MLIDTNLSWGHWPFADLPRPSLDALEDHLAKHRIEQALVSPLETLFLPDPDRLNRQLIQATRLSSRLVAIPTLNLALPDWRESLERYRSLTDLKAIKLYPNFHNYSLVSRRCRQLVGYLAQHDIRLVLNIRMVDERHQYFALRIKGVAVKQIATFARRHPDFPFLCTGLTLPEIRELAAQCDTFLTDMSFADWHELIPKLLESLPPERLVFGSHSPLMTTQANVYKLEVAPISDTLKRQIGRENAQRFFRLD